MIWLSGTLGSVSALSWEHHRQPAVSYWTQSPYTGEQIENQLLPSSAHSGGTIKGDNCCLASNWRLSNIFFLPFHNTSGLWCHLLQQRRVSIFSRVLKSNRAGGSGFLWDVCCSRHHSEAEHAAILSEGFQINTSFCFKAHNSLSKAVPQPLCTNLILRESAAASETHYRRIKLKLASYFSWCILKPRLIHQVQSSFYWSSLTAADGALELMFLAQGQFDFAL